MNKLLLIVPSYLLLVGCSTMDGGVQNTDSMATQKPASTASQDSKNPAKPVYMITYDEDTVGSAEFPTHRPATGHKLVIFDPNIPAWGAYDENGNRVKTGRASGGKSYCPDLHHGCKTVTGTFKVYRKGSADCKSSKFPLETHGGAPTPYCMHFYKGYALHGSYDVPGHNASHGCVRVLPSAAQWLNQEFVTIGTTLVVKPYQG